MHDSADLPDEEKRPEEGDDGGALMWRNSFRFIALALAIAIAGCASRNQHVDRGWYLMQPPVGRGNSPRTGAKLADWQVLAFFERPSECDAARQRGLAAYPSYLMVAEKQSLNSVQMSQRLAASTLCVSADDPRINWFRLKWR
jgi:hypothetical protein